MILGWDVVRGLYAIGRDRGEELAHVLGERQAATIGPRDALRLRQGYATHRRTSAKARSWVLERKTAGRAIRDSPTFNTGVITGWARSRPTDVASNRRIKG